MLDNRPESSRQHNNAPREWLTMFPRLLGSGLLITCLLAILYVADLPYVNYVNYKTTDLIQQFEYPEQISEKLVVVDIDEESLLRYGQWPWPRYRIAELLGRINDGAPKRIGVNIIFAEEDRNSPEVWQRNLAREFGQHVDLSHLPEEMKNYDLVLADVLRDGPFVLGYAFIFDSGEIASQCKMAEAPISAEIMTSPAFERLQLYEAQSVVCSRNIIADATEESGFLNGSVDSDGILRRLPLVIKYNDRLYPSFDLAMVLGNFPAVHEAGLSFQQNELQIPTLIAGDHLFPMDVNGNFRLKKTAQDKALHLSARDVLADTFDAAVFRDSMVLVGTSATGLTKTYSTPFSHNISELDINTQLIGSLLEKRPIIRARYFLYCEVLTSFLLLIFLVLFSMRTTGIRACVSCLAGMGLVWIGAIVIYRLSGFLFSPLLPSAVVVVNCFALTSIRFYYYQRDAKSEAGDALLLLKSNETTLQSILKTIPDIVFRLDQYGKFVFISPAICKYVQQPATLLGKSVFALVNPEDMEKAWGRLNERRTGDRATEDLEIRLKFSLPTDSVREERFFKIRAEGLYQEVAPGNFQFTGTQGIIRDITVEKKLESQLLQAQKMEAIGAMAAGIAHDLNNILSGLVSYPDLLLHEVEKDSPIFKKISIIRKSGEMAAAIVQDLLFLARRGVQIREVVSLNKVVAEYLASAEFEQLHKRHENCEVVPELDDGLANIDGSSVHLTKVVMNLVHNGLEAMAAGGKLVIKTKNIRLAEDYFGYEPIPAGEYVCLCVSDSGIGMSAESVEHIFEPFFSRKSLGKSGTGLGMTVILATIKDHSGFIDLASAEGQGTEITVYLPVTGKQSTSPSAPAALEELVGSETILVVDDVREQLEIANNILEKLGYRVLLAESGAQALEIFSTEKVDLVLLDMIMQEGMDGLATFGALQKCDPKVRAIITSGHSEPERVASLQKFGAGAYVQKPYTLERLGRAIRGELDRKNEPG